MKDSKTLNDDKLDAVSGGTLADGSGKDVKDVIRSLYQGGTKVEVGMEKEIDKLMKPVVDYFRGDGK